MTFKRPSNDRNLSFEMIANEAQLPLEEVSEDSVLHIRGPWTRAVGGTTICCLTASARVFLKLSIFYSCLKQMEMYVNVITIIINVYCMHASV